MFDNTLKSTTTIPRPSDSIEGRVARRLRSRRIELGLEPRLLDAAIGEAPGTVERFEQLDRRIGAAHLYRLAHLLGVGVAYFFAEDPMPEEAGNNAEGTPVGPQAADGDVEARTGEAKRYAELYFRIPDSQVRHMVRTLLKSLVGHHRSGCGNGVDGTAALSSKPWQNGKDLD